MTAFNEWLARRVTLVVGTMWCAYAFAALALLSLGDAIHQGRAALIAWIAQTFLQLVLLPLIMVGQAVLNKASDERAAEDHDAIMEALADIREMHAALSVNVTVEEKV